MDPTLKESLDELRAQNRDMALAQASQGEQLAILIEQGAEIIKLLTPVKGDGPTLEEILGHIVGQLTELTGLARQQAKMLSAMEQNLPGDVARALTTSTSKHAGHNGIAAGPNGGSRG